jgi:hypothetical protein
VKELANRSAYHIQYVIVVILNLVFKIYFVSFTPSHSQEDSDPIKYRRVLVSTLLHVSVHDFTTFADVLVQIANKVGN